MTADYQGFRRKAHFEYLPLPGGSAAIRRPSRIATGYLYTLLGARTLNADIAGRLNLDDTEIEIIKRQVDQGLNTPLTSSCGRLFDAVSALLGVRQQVEYEGQAAIELEVAADGIEANETYPFRLEKSEGVTLIRIKGLFSAIIEDIRQGVQIGVISAKFHNTISRIVIRLCHDISEETGLKQAALSGGVFQNRRLLNLVVDGLKKENMIPLLHSQVPCNDGCISLGQAVAGGKEVAISCV
jgi:hydrogenase maturation protein HypF